MTRPARPTLRTVPHGALTADDLDRMATLFDDEYLSDFGRWTPERPYGYAGHDVHVLAEAGGRLVGHVGWGRRTIGVGGADVVVAGVGGVLVSPAGRGLGLGGRLMAGAAATMRDAGDVEFGYLGCREEVVPFYLSCGWRRVRAAERYVDRVTGTTREDPPGAPLLVLPLGDRAWPSGPVDLRGAPW